MEMLNRLPAPGSCTTKKRLAASVLSYMILIAALLGSPSRRDRGSAICEKTTKM